MRYLLNHWHGKLPLKSAVWIGLITVSIVGCFIEYLIHKSFFQHSSYYAIIAIGYFVLFHVFVFIWQALGVLRSCDVNIKNYIASGWTRSAQFLILTGFTATLIWGISLGQKLWKLKTESELQANELNNGPDYSFEINNINTVSIKGIISPGITRQLKKYLDLNPEINLIELNSTGGNIFEARGIAKLITQRNLNTHVSQRCLSSCTTVFVAGHKRTMAEKATLGFHQYKINSNKLFAPNVNTKKELDKDIASFLKQGVSQRFLDKAFTKAHNDMWFPDHNELIEAGIIN